MKKNHLPFLLILLTGCLQQDIPQNNSYPKTSTENPQEIEYEITFISDDIVFKKIKVHSGEKASISENPIKSGHCLLGWYTEKSFINFFDLNTPITSDITLYAKWIDKSIGNVCKTSELKNLLNSLPQYGGIQKIIIAEVIPDLDTISSILKEVAPTSKIHLDLSYCTGIDTIPTFCLWSSYLNKITIPHSIRFIQSCFPFNDLTEIYFAGTLDEWFLIEFNDKNSYFDDAIVYIDGNKLSEITVPASVTVINEGLFAGMDISAVTLHNKLLKIGNGAFENTKITNIDLPDSVEYIGKNAFLSTPLENISISNTSKLQTIDSYAFTSTKLESFNIPPNLTYLSSYLFYNSKLTSIEIPSKIKAIGDYCFNGCENLTNVTINKGVEYIGAYAFGAAYGSRSGVTKIKYNGTKADWNAIEKDTNFGSTYLKTIECTDGNISL